jgi:hypothetical protein
VDARGAMPSPALVDCGWLAAAVSNRIAKAAPVETPRVTPAPLPARVPVAAGGSVFTGNNELNTAGATLLQADCPETLKTFSGYLRAAQTVPSWGSYVDYLDRVVQALGTRYVPNATTGAVAAASSGKPKTSAVGINYANRRARYLTRATEEYGQLRERLQALKRSSSTLYLLYSQIHQIGCNLDRAGCYAGRAGLAGAQALSQDGAQVKAIADRWRQTFSERTVSDILRDERRAPGSAPVPAPVPAPAVASGEERLRRQIEAVTSRIPNSVAALGKLTLEMEVAPGVWWPVIVFTEDGR